MIIPLEVIDTAIKMGLGAIVSALGAYALSRVTHNKEMEKIYLNRQRILLEGIAEQIERFTIAALDYWAALAEQNDYANKKIPKNLQSECEQREKNLIQTFSEMTNAEAKLLLLGEKEAQKLLREYSDYVKGFLPVYREGQWALSKSDIEGFRLEVIPKLFLR